MKKLIGFLAWANLVCAAFNLSVFYLAKDAICGIIGYLNMIIFVFLGLAHEDILFREQHNDPRD